MITKKSVAVLALLFIGGIIGGIGGIWWSLNVDPTVEIPIPQMPSPNAFEDYQTAAKKLIDEDEKIRSRRIFFPGQSLAEKEALVKKNAGTLKKLREGFTHECRLPPIRSWGEDKLQNLGSKFRDLAWLFRLEGQVRADQGHWGGAVSSNLDALRLGYDIFRGGVGTARLNGIACQSIGRAALWEALEHLDARQSQAAAQRLEELLARHVPLAETLEEEKWSLQAGREC